MRRLAAGAAAAVLCIGLVHCGSGPDGPTPLAPQVFAISPATGPSTGATSVRITGANFAAGASVTIGGAFATGVTVESSSALTALTPAHAVGAADVVVTVGGLSGSLPSGFSYQPATSTPPVIASVVGQGTKYSNEPAQFADLGEQITLTATVQDPDTPEAQLTFEWSADAGTLSGTGSSVKWTAPAAATTPLLVHISVTVSDIVNTVNGGATIAVHDSVKEVGDMAQEFLTDFSQQRDPSVTLHNFSTSARCQGGRDDEAADVDKNRSHYQILDWTVGAATVSFDFGGRPCSYLPRDGDSCAAVPTRWHSLCKETFFECTKGVEYTATGTDYVTAVYEQSQWKLCASSYKNDGPIRPYFIR